MTTPPSDEPASAPPGRTAPPGYAAAPGRFPPLPGGSPPPPGYGTPPAGYRPTPGYGAPAPAPVAPRPPALSPSGQPLAEFSDRLLARLIDTAILTGVALALSVPLLLLVFTTTLNSIEVDADGTVQDPDVFAFVLPWLLLMVGLFALSLLATYLYEVEFQRRTGQTVGKRIMKIRVVPLDPTAAAPVGLDRGTAARRWLVHSVAGAFIPAFSYLDGLWQLWDQPYRQCLHDKFARTVVVRNKP